MELIPFVNRYMNGEFFSMPHYKPSPTIRNMFPNSGCITIVSQLNGDCCKLYHNLKKTIPFEWIVTILIIFSEIVNGHDLMVIGIPKASICLASGSYTMFDKCFPWGPSYPRKVSNH